MGKVYCIGKFQFDSYKEYQEALDDIEKIKDISKKMDINEPGVAERLYTLIRDGKIHFKSGVVGDDYLLYLSDMMLEDYHTLSRRTLGGRILGKVRQLSPGQIVGTICMAGAIVCFLIFFGSEYHDQKKVREMERLKSEQDISAASDWMSARLIQKLRDARGEEPIQIQTGTVENEIYSAGAEDMQEDGPQILPEFQKLHGENSDFAGWISIEGTEIDYPVMQAVPESSEFYLNHNYEGEKDINGSIFLDSRNNYEKPDDNLILYGHNMKSGMMFGGLEQYLEKDYWEAHKKVSFNTIYERAEYEIIAVCLSKVADGEKTKFHYYDFINAGSEEAFDLYLENIQKLNVLGEDLGVSYGDKLLTLSTCNNYTKDGRLFLVAKKCNP